MEKPNRNSNLPDPHPSENISYLQAELDDLQKAVQYNGVISRGLTTILNLEELSWKAKGLALFILTNPHIFSDPTKPKEPTLFTYSKEGTDAVLSGVKELQRIGLLRKQIIRNKNGRNYVVGSTWKINFLHDREED